MLAALSCALVGGVALPASIGTVCGVCGLGAAISGDRVVGDVARKVVSRKHPKPGKDRYTDKCHGYSSTVTNSFEGFIINGCCARVCVP